MILNDEIERHWRMVFKDNNVGVDGTKARIHTKKGDVYNLEIGEFVKGRYLVEISNKDRKKVAWEVFNNNVVEEGVEYEDICPRGFDFKLLYEEMDRCVGEDVWQARPQEGSTCDVFLVVMCLKHLGEQVCLPIPHRIDFRIAKGRPKSDVCNEDVYNQELPTTGRLVLFDFVKHGSSVILIYPSPVTLLCVSLRGSCSWWRARILRTMLRPFSWALDVRLFCPV